MKEIYEIRSRTQSSRSGDSIYGKVIARPVDLHQAEEMYESGENQDYISSNERLIGLIKISIDDDDQIVDEEVVKEKTVRGYGVIYNDSENENE